MAEPLPPMVKLDPEAGSIPEQLNVILAEHNVKLIDLFREWDDDGNGAIDGPAGAWAAAASRWASPLIRRAMNLSCRAAPSRALCAGRTTRSTTPASRWWTFATPSRRAGCTLRSGYSKMSVSFGWLFGLAGLFRLQILLSRRSTLALGLFAPRSGYVRCRK